MGIMLINNYYFYYFNSLICSHLILIRSLLQKYKLFFNFYFRNYLFLSGPKLYSPISKLRDESFFNADSPSPIAWPPSGPKSLTSPIFKLREESCFNAESPSPIALPP